MRGLSAWFEFHSLLESFLLNNHGFETVGGPVSFKAVIVGENAFSKLFGFTHGALLIVSGAAILSEQSDVTFL